MEQPKKNGGVPDRQDPQQNVSHVFVKTFYRNGTESTDHRIEPDKVLKTYMNYLKLFPVVFLIMIAGFFYLLVLLLQTNFSIYLLMGIFTMVLIREIGTLIFSINMRKNFLRPLGHLQKGVEEVADGNYGYTIDEEVPTSINGLFTSFNEMSHQLKEGQIIKEKYEQNRNELIAGISHDLKTPITSILGYIEGINEGVANSEEKLQTYMDIIYNNAQYTNQLIDDLFLFSKLDINQMDYHFDQILIKDYFEDIFVEKKIDLEEQGSLVAYSIDIHADKLMAFDAKMIYRVVANLISNAVKYNDKEQLKLYLLLEDVPGDEAMIHVSIKDNGQGIEQAQLEHIFDVFYRADASRNKDIGGSGLGLSISKQLVEAHGGRIWAESKLGEGTTFHFTLVDQKGQYDGKDTNY